LFDEWRSDLERKIRSRDEHPALEAHLAKYRSLMPSLALLFHLLEVVDGTAEGAVSHHAATMSAAWCDFLEAHARRIYQAVTQQSLFAAKRLADRVAESALPSPFTAGDVLRKGWTGLSMLEEVRDAAEILEDAHWLRSEKISSGEKGGRPRFHYRINPRSLSKEEAK